MERSKQERQAMHDVLDRALDALPTDAGVTVKQVDSIETHQQINAENLSVRITSTRQQMEYPQRKGPPIKRWERRIRASVSVRIRIQSELNLDPHVPVSE
jgi:hypothetical protein